MPASSAAPFSSAPASSRTFKISPLAKFADHGVQIHVAARGRNAEDFDAGALSARAFGESGDCVVKTTTSFLCGFHEFRAQRQAQPRIHDDAQERAAARLAGAVGQARIVGEDGADAGEKGVGFVTQALDCFARWLAGDPGGAARAHGRFGRRA